MTQNAFGIRVMTLASAILVLTSSCSKPEASSFSSKENITTIPFHYSKQGHILTEVVFKKDTFQFLIDTGSDKSFVSFDIEGKDTRNEVLVTDGTGIQQTFNEVKLNRLHWGDLQFENFSFGQFQISVDDIQGVIGGDILRNFCVKIDNDRKVIELSSKSKYIQKNGEAIPFQYLHNSIQFTSLVGSHSVGVKLDTGSNLEIQLNEESHSGSIAYNKLENDVLWKEYVNTPFKKRDRRLPDTVGFYVTNYTIGTITFQNTAVSHYKRGMRNLMGTIFLRRFKSVTIDYPNAMLYFELPAGNAAVHFSDKQVGHVPTAFLSLFYNRINSLGLSLTNDSPFLINVLQIKDQNKNLQIGDTLAGIDNFLFSKRVFEKLNKKDQIKFELLELQNEQKELVKHIFHKKDSATFHFVKNDILISVKGRREHQLKSSPKIGYSFSSKQEDLGFYAAGFSNFSNQNLTSFSLHIPWFTLSQEEIQISSYKDGKEQKLSNNPNKIIENSPIPHEN